MTIEALDSLSFAPEEPYEHSALFGASQSERVWLPDNEDKDSYFSYHVNRVVSARTGRSLGPRFKSAQTVEGLFIYECFVGIGKGAWRTIVNSGPQKSTLDAMNAAIEKVCHIPIEQGTNWHEQLSIFLPYKGMRPPVFRNDVSIGMPAIRCTLVWGIEAELRTVISDAFYTRERAFNDAVQRAMHIGPVSKPAPTSVPAKINWPRMVKRKIQAIAGYNNLTVRFHIMKTSGRFRCQILWGKGLTNSVESLPLAEQSAAFDDAVKRLEQRVETTSRPLLKCSANDDEETNISSSDLLAIAKQRWAVERNYLFQKTSPSYSEIVRLNVLSSFLVVLDPLRCYELDRTRRSEAIAQLHRELSGIWNSISTKGKYDWRINALRLLSGGVFKEPGSPLTITPTVENEINRHGYEVSETLRDLLSVRFVRKSADGIYSVSPIGSTTLEEALTVGMKSSAIGRTLPPTMVAFLLDLKTRLSG